MNRPQRQTITLAIEQETVERVTSWREDTTAKTGIRFSMNAAMNALLKRALEAEQQNDFQPRRAG
jgi:hypothetical protein